MSRLVSTVMTVVGVLAALALSACSLIDQRMFAPSPEEEPIPVVPVAHAPVEPRTPLITVDYAIPAPNYRDLLRLAVRAAESRSNSVQYDLVAAEPDIKTGVPSQAFEIMRAMMAEGVPAARIHLGLRGEPALTAVQVRVYIR